MSRTYISTQGLLAALPPALELLPLHRLRYTGCRYADPNYTGPGYTDDTNSECGVYQLAISNDAGCWSSHPIIFGLTAAVGLIVGMLIVLLMVFLEIVW